MDEVPDRVETFWPPDSETLWQDRRQQFQVTTVLGIGVLAFFAVIGMVAEGKSPFAFTAQDWSILATLPLIAACFGLVSGVAVALFRKSWIARLRRRLRLSLREGEILQALFPCWLIAPKTLPWREGLLAISNRRVLFASFHEHAHWQATLGPLRDLELVPLELYSLGTRRWVWARGDVLNGFRFAGEDGSQQVYAIQSIAPLNPRLPEWFKQGGLPTQEEVSYLARSALLTPNFEALDPEEGEEAQLALRRSGLALCPEGVRRGLLRWILLSLAFSVFLGPLAGVVAAAACLPLTWLEGKARSAKRLAQYPLVFLGWLLALAMLSGAYLQGAYSKGLVGGANLSEAFRSVVQAAEEGLSYSGLDDLSTLGVLMLALAFAWALALRLRVPLAALPPLLPTIPLLLAFVDPELEFLFFASFCFAGMACLELVLAYVATDLLDLWLLHRLGPAKARLSLYEVYLSYLEPAKAETAPPLKPEPV